MYSPSEQRGDPEERASDTCDGEPVCRAKRGNRRRLQWAERTWLPRRGRGGRNGPAGARAELL